MTKNNISKLRRQLQAIPQQLESLLPALRGHGALLKAYLSFSPRTCGKPGCRCARGELHPAWILRHPEGRRTRSRSLAQRTYQRLCGSAEEYRRFRQARVRWNHLMKQADEWLRQVETLRSMDLQQALEDE